MASKKENIKALFTHTRSRLVIIFTAVLLIVTSIIGFMKFRTITTPAIQATSKVGNVPQIQSIPGALEQTPQYQELQVKQNIRQAQIALEKGGFAIPTMGGAQKIGEGVQPIGPKEGAVGFSTLAKEELEGPQKSLWIQELQESKCSKKVVAQVVREGATILDLKKACTCLQLKNYGYKVSELKPVCTCPELKLAGFQAVELKELNFSAEQLRACEFVACELHAAGFSTQQMKAGGYSPGELKGAGYPAKEIDRAFGLPKGISEEDIRKAGCSVDALKRLRAAGVTAAVIKSINNCTAAQLKAAGFSAAELKAAGFSAADLKDAGFSAAELKAAGFSAAQLKAAGFSAADLKEAGFGNQELKEAGFSQETLAKADLTSPLAQQQANLRPMQSIPAIAGQHQLGTVEASNAQKLQEILKKQNLQMDEQRYQQKIQQLSSQMFSSANQALQNWRSISQQQYIMGTPPKTKNKKEGSAAMVNQGMQPGEQVAHNPNARVFIKTGEVLFAIIDTSVSSDEPGPILATIVSGKLKGAKLIGNFVISGNVNAKRMVITFQTLSVPGAARSIGINAYAIDPNTARTALASNVDNHYLLRYGSLFASSFLQGFGNAFQSANTTVTIGGTGGGNNFSIANGINRSILENAVIGLATLGKNWGQIAQTQFNTPITIEVYAGTAIGVLFTQDLASIN